MVELQITQEYLGQSRHLVYLAPMWKEFFSQVNPRELKGIAGVANIGLDKNWCGHHFSQANWYAFGRLAWNPMLPSDKIAREWLEQTFTREAAFVDAAAQIMDESREACVDYMMPLGLHHIFKFDHHYGPEPDGFIKSYPLEWCPVYYHKADKQGVGFDRSSKGTDAVSQYRPELARKYDNLATCPENLLLWFHHVPWDYKMKDGSTLWESLQFHYNRGVITVEQHQNLWHSGTTRCATILTNSVGVRLTSVCTTRWRMPVSGATPVLNISDNLLKENKTMRKLLAISFMLLALTIQGKEINVTSPDGKLVVTIDDAQGLLTYRVSYMGQTMLNPSALGLKTDISDFTRGLTFKEMKESNVDKTYTMTRTKASSAHYVARQADITYLNSQGQPLTITFCVSNNDIAYRYALQPKGENRLSTVIYSETSSFNMPDGTTTFLTPQSLPMVGWQRTKPSYEEDYKADAPMTERSAFGEGFTFPCLFKVPAGWVLISETGVGSNYCASHLSDYVAGRGYTIAFPNIGEMQGLGSAWAGLPLPGCTPWRTITVGTTLKPIVEGLQARPLYVELAYLAG